MVYNSEQKSKDLNKRNITTTSFIPFSKSIYISYVGSPVPSVNIFNNKLCTKSKDYKTVTVLDIYGFENLEQNTFDQFCINWANEKIQNDYVKRMFVNLQNMYKEEGIYLDDMKYDHKGSLQLFERPCGIVDLINEESCSNFGNESNLETKIKNYCKDVIVSNSIFQISHFATDVKYDLTGFITKNNEAGLNFNDVYKIPKDKNIKEMVQNDFIAYLLSSEEKKPTIKKPTVLKTFKRSLDDLFESINDSKVLYVRCIKPNVNKSNVFDDDYVHNQLKTSGIIETIEISKKTYSHYVFNEEYDERYGMLHGTYKIKRGKNRVFLSNETLYKLEQDRNALHNEFKQIILDIMKTQYEQKRLQSNKTILQQVLSKYIKEQREIKKKLNEQQQILKINQEFEQMKETEDRDMIENENTREIDTNNDKLSYNRKQIINYSLNIENENNDVLNSDIVKRQVTYITSEIDTNSNKVHLNVENVDCINKDIAETKYDEICSKSEQFCSDNTRLTNENAEIDKHTNSQTKYVKNSLIDSEYRFDKKEITFVDSKIVYKKNKGDSDMDTGKHIVINVPGQENNEETVSELREKLKRYEKFCKAPCRNCKAMEIKYKYQTEELKRKNMLNLEIETYKKKIADLEKEIKLLNSKNKHDETHITESKNNDNIIHTDDTKKDEANNEDKKVYKVFVKDSFIISFTSPYDVFGCLIELFIDFCPDFSSTFLPKNEALAFAQIVYQTMYKLNKNGESMKDLTDMFVHELKERFIIFERQINKVCFIVSNIIELKKVFVGERKTRLYITEISFNETLSTFDDVITILFKHICEMLKKKLQDLLPDTIILHQELKEFSCKERYFSSFFGKPPSISKLLEALEYSVSVLQHYHLPDQAWEECINYLLKTINARSFNGTIVKNDFLSFNRGMQINNNLNKIEKFCREIGFPEGVHNLEHIKDVVKLINYVKAGQKIDTILNGCTYLNFLQVTELLGKFKKDEKEYLAKEIKNYVCKDTTLEKFVNDSKINVFLNYEGVQHKFLVPRYVPSKYIQSILESL
ncbi:hypothetical protein BDAP_002178 [Binucleata daphniae]